LIWLAIAGAFLLGVAIGVVGLFVYIADRMPPWNP
jgi:hypothetical protein